jgi:hypothetical protein
MSAIMRKAVEGWGAKVIDRLSADLHAAFPRKGPQPATSSHLESIRILVSKRRRT